MVAICSSPLAPFSGVSAVALSEAADDAAVVLSVLDSVLLPPQPARATAEVHMTAPAKIAEIIFFINWTSPSFLFLYNITDQSRKIKYFPT